MVRNRFSNNSLVESAGGEGMSWLDVMVFSGLAFVIGCSIGAMAEIRMSVKGLDEMWSLHKESEKINREMRDEMTALIEKLVETIGCEDGFLIYTSEFRGEVIDRGGITENADLNEDSNTMMTIEKVKNAKWYVED